MLAPAIAIGPARPELRGKAKGPRHLRETWAPAFLAERISHFEIRSEPVVLLPGNLTPGVALIHEPEGAFEAGGGHGGHREDR